MKFQGVERFSGKPENSQNPDSIVFGLVRFLAHCFGLTWLTLPASVSYFTHTWLLVLLYFWESLAPENRVI